MRFKSVMLLLSLLFVDVSHAGISDSVYMKVHFLYGSKPSGKYRREEPKWFGGKLGGHVGIELDSGSILNFNPGGNVRMFENNSNPNGVFAEYDWEAFRESVGGNGDSNKLLSIVIPISKRQKQILDSLAKVYLRNSPYDYAFFGMRCGAAAASLLQSAGILKNKSHGRTWRAYFYPKKLRKKLLRMAEENHWQVWRQAGTKRRNWEGD